MPIEYPFKKINIMSRDAFDKIGQTNTDELYAVETSVVIESKYNPDGSWYRLYSDGWLEQGGAYNTGQFSGYKNGTQNLVKPFADKSYILALCGDSTDAQSPVCNNKTTTSFDYIKLTNLHNVASWYACGQGASSVHEGSLPSDPGLEDLLG